MRYMLLALAAGAASWACPAQAQMVRAQDPAGVARTLEAAGYAAEPGADAVGDPMITSHHNGTTWQLYFYNCTDNRACATVQFHSGYTVADRVSLESINEWNRTQRFGRAYLDGEGDPILEMDVDLDDGGLSPLLFVDNVEFWLSSLTRFEKHIGYGE